MYLSVYKPAHCTRENPCPVMQWIYGGGWKIGGNDEVRLTWHISASPLTHLHEHCIHLIPLRVDTQSCSRFRCLTLHSHKLYVFALPCPRSSFHTIATVLANTHTHTHTHHLVRPIRWCSTRTKVWRCHHRSQLSSGRIGLDCSR